MKFLNWLKTVFSMALQHPARLSGLLVASLIFFLACGSKKQNVDALILQLRKSYPHEHYAIAPNMATIFIDEEKPGGTELKDLLDSVSSMEVMVFSKNRGGKDGQLQAITLDITRRLKRNGLLQYGLFSSAKENLSVWVLKNMTLVSDLVVVINSGQKVYLVHFSGQMPMEKLAKLILPKNRPILDYIYRLDSPSVR